MKKRFFTLLFLLVSLGSVNANDYYLATGSSGDGTGVGGWGNAAAGAGFLNSLLGTTLVPGTHIYMKAGSYNFVAILSVPLPIYLSKNDVLIQGGFPTAATGLDLSGYNPNTNNVNLIYSYLGVPSTVSQTLFKSDGTGLAANVIELKGLTVTQYAGSTTIFGGGSGDAGTYRFTDIQITPLNTPNGVFVFDGLTQGSSAVFTNCFFSRSNSPLGTGAINGGYVPFTVTNCSFSNCGNFSSSSIGGGAISTNYPGLISINNSSFCDNQLAPNNVGGGGAISSSNVGTVLNISGCTFYRNSVYSGKGGAVYNSGGVLNINNCSFISNSTNSALNGGGAIYVSNSSGTIKNSSFYNNMAASNVTVGNGSSDGPGGGAINFAYNNSNFMISNCRFLGNNVVTGSTGGAIVLYNLQGATATIKNCYFLGNYLVSNGNVGVTLPGFDVIAFSAGGNSGILNMNTDTLQLTNQAAYKDYTGTSTSSYSFTGTNVFGGTFFTASGAAPSYTCPTYSQTIVLPVTVTSFTAIKVSGGNLLMWSASDAINVSHFDVQRQINGSAFTTLSRVGFGEAYRYIDEHPLKGVNYYRLAMVDKDNSIQYSTIIALENVASQTVFGNAYPIPTTGLITVNLFSSTTGNVLYNIADVTGKVVKQIKLSTDLGANAHQLNINRLSPGVYFVTARDGEGGVHNFKIVKE